MKARLVGCGLLLAACQLTTSSGAHFGGGGTSSGGGGGTSSGGDDRVSGASTGHTVTVPDVFNLTRPQAEAALRSAGITGNIELDTNHGSCGSVVDGKVVELGHVCRQAPAAGQQTSSTLFVTLMLQEENPWHGELGGGRSWYLLPDVVGLPLDQAFAKLKAAGFPSMDVFHVYYVQRADCKPGIVCEMVPRALERADNSSDKNLTVGQPADRHLDPDHRPKPTTAPTTPAKKPGLGDQFRPRRRR
jgi:beta-lactam-binding protein with PASTA domain